MRNHRTQSGYRRLFVTLLFALIFCSQAQAKPFYRYMLEDTVYKKDINGDKKKEKIQFKHITPERDPQAFAEEDEEDPDDVSYYIYDVGVKRSPTNLHQ